MLERGVVVSYETVRRWCLKFGQQYANGLRRRRLQPGDKWHLDEVSIKINGPSRKRAIAWLRGVAQHAAYEEEWDLLEEAARGMCIWDAASNEFDQQIATRDWLRQLRGRPAQILAGILREHPGSARYYYELTSERSVDMAIRSAIASATRR